jgi:hypothetical protein
MSNSSCLIALEATGSLGILEQLYSATAVPDAGRDLAGSRGFARSGPVIGSRGALTESFGRTA